MSGLADRLVTAATNAADKAEVEVYDGRRLTRAELRYISEAVVAAALRELAADEREHRFGYPLHDLRMLAVVVERGE